LSLVFLPRRGYCASGHFFRCAGKIDDASRLPVGLGLFQALDLNQRLVGPLQPLLGRFDRLLLQRGNAEEDSTVFRIGRGRLPAG